MRLSLAQKLRFAGVAVFTCAFWCCVLLDREGVAYPVLLALNVALLVALIYDLVRSWRAMPSDPDGLRLTGAARAAYDILFIAWSVLTLVAIVTDARVGAYDLSSWMLTVEICLPSDLVRPSRDAPSYDPPLPPQR